MAEQRRARFLRYGAEFAIVFLGVWLGLLAEDYRERRQERQAERVSLGRLIADMDSDILDMTGNLERTLEGHSAARWILDHSDARGVDADSVARQLTRLQYTSVLGANTSEYSALKASGRINLIRDPDLRQGLTQLYETYPYVANLHATDSDALSAAMSSIAPEVRPSMVEGPSFSGMRVVGDADAILSDPHFLLEVANMVDVRAFLEAQYRLLLIQIADLQTRARTELGVVQEF